MVKIEFKGRCQFSGGDYPSLMSARNFRLSGSIRLIGQPIVLSHDFRRIDERPGRVPRVTTSSAK
jgi:hypothetical protein